MNQLSAQGISEFYKQCMIIIVTKPEPKYCLQPRPQTGPRTMG